MIREFKKINSYFAPAKYKKVEEEIKIEHKKIKKESMDTYSKIAKNMLKEFKS